MIKNINTSSFVKIKTDDLRFVPLAVNHGAEKYLVDLYKKGELIGDYYLDATEPVKGEFSMKGHVLHFNGRDLINFTHQSVFKLAVALGYKEEPMTADESALIALENESPEQ